MSLRLLAISCLLVLIIMPQVALAGGLQRNQVDAKQACNPHPDPDDIVLPMPCGLQMAFRAVDIPTQGLLWDRSLSLGCDDCARPSGMEYYDRRYSSAISGPFTPEDLPAAWHKSLGGSTDIRHNYYFIGKYEVSVLQWKAVMDGTCPSGAVTADDTRPKADISWFDAVDFSRRYTEWLLRESPDNLPRYHNDSKNVGYLRLPTEAEWEYAARGGSRVPSETLAQGDFFPLAPNTSFADYAVYRVEGDARIFESPQPLGTLRPNPLGLYDTAGNVAEMVLEPFHFSVGGRLHGSAGGFLRKGGSYCTGDGEIKPGRREESSFFTVRGATHSPDMGMRLVLSGIDTPEGGRTQQLATEWQHLGEQGSVLIKGDNPLKEIDKLLEQVRDPNLKTNFSKLREIIKDNQVQLEKKDSENVEGLIRTTAYTLEALRSYAVRTAFAIKEKKKIQEESEKRKSEKKETDAMYKADQQDIEKFEQLRLTFIDGIQFILDFYKQKLAEIVKYDEASYKKNFIMVKSEYEKGGNDNFGFVKNMVKNLEIVNKHITLLRQNKQSMLTKSKILDEVLIPSLRSEIKI